MQTKEWTFVNRSGWSTPHGPWDAEPDKRQWMDPETGLPCLIRRGPSGALCGFVGVPREHPAHGEDYNDVEVSVHGGLTFGSACRGSSENGHGICHVVEPGEPDDVWWFGFDCAHSGDLCPQYHGRYSKYDNGDTYRDFAYVTAEVTSLAKQLKEQS
jgi:hypothetical protein